MMNEKAYASLNTLCEGNRFTDIGSGATSEHLDAENLLGRLNHRRRV